MTKELSFTKRMRHRSAGVIGAVFLLVLGVSVPIATDAAQAPPAGALCANGLGGGMWASWGQEWDYAGTCDWDNTYHGWLNDSIADGSCVWAEFIDAGYWNVQHYECNTGGWSDFWKWDIDGDNFSWELMCRNQGCLGNGAWQANWSY
jgi:hypothetical protein